MDRKLAKYRGTHPKPYPTIQFHFCGESKLIWSCHSVLAWNNAAVACTYLYCLLLARSLPPNIAVLACFPLAFIVL